ncbi:hypothetical protein V2J09_016912, partial [Rumex salicifolius]
SPHYCSHPPPFPLPILESSLLTKILPPLAAPLHLRLNLSLVLEKGINLCHLVLKKAWIFIDLLVSPSITSISFDLHQQKNELQLHRVDEYEVENHSWSYCSAYPLCDWDRDCKGFHSLSDNQRGEESTVEQVNLSEKGVEVEQPRKSSKPKKSPVMNAKTLEIIIISYDDSNA